MLFSSTYSAYRQFAKLLLKDISTYPLNTTPIFFNNRIESSYYRGIDVEKFKMVFEKKKKGILFF